MQARLSKRIIDSISPGNRDTFVWDTDVKGFGVKTTPAGRQVYVVQTRLNARTRPTGSARRKSATVGVRQLPNYS
jgi:hypothetical protein